MEYNEIKNEIAMELFSRLLKLHHEKKILDFKYDSKEMSKFTIYFRGIQYYDCISINLNDVFNTKFDTGHVVIHDGHINKKEYSFESIENADKIKDIVDLIIIEIFNMSIKKTCLHTSFALGSLYDILYNLPRFYNSVIDKKHFSHYIHENLYKIKPVLDNYLNMIDSTSSYEVNMVIKDIQDLQVNTEEGDNSNDATPIELFESYEFTEGSRSLTTHLKIERSSELIRLKKERFKEEHGSLYCEVCDFNFSDYYGDIGKGFIEGHHNNQLSESRGMVITNLDDISLVCSNCHRMLHKRNPPYTKKELQDIILRKKQV